jgi:O-antigen/teichoic acid export membrane protein
MAGRSDLSFFNTAILFISSVALDWTLIPRFGLSGAAFAGAFTIVLVNILRVTEVWMLLRIHPFTLSFLKPIIAGLVGGAVVLGMRAFPGAAGPWNDLMQGLVFVTIYCAMILLLRLEAEDLLVLRAIQRRISGRPPGTQGRA